MGIEAKLIVDGKVTTVRFNTGDPTEQEIMDKFSSGEEPIRTLGWIGHWEVQACKTRFLVIGKPTTIGGQEMRRSCTLTDEAIQNAVKTFSSEEFFR